MWPARKHKCQASVEKFCAGVLQPQPHQAHCNGMEETCWYDFARPNRLYAKTVVTRPNSSVEKTLRRQLPATDSGTFVVYFFQFRNACLRNVCGTNSAKW